MASPERFDAIFRVLEKSRVHREIMLRGAGDDALPEWATPYSLIGVRDLVRIADALQVGPPQTFADLACGLGGPGLLVAERTGASLVGVDFSSEAVAAAERCAASRGLADRARFVVGEMSATGLPDASLDAVMSIDAIQLVDPSAAVGEIARILRPGAVAAITTWEAAQPLRETMVPDYRPILEANGLAVQAYEQPEGWRDRNTAQFAAVLARAGDLIAEIGEDVAEGIIAEATRAPQTVDLIRRVLIIARRA